MMQFHRAIFVVSAACLSAIGASLGNAAVAGSETFLYQFSPPNGQSPESPLLALNGRLYGTSTLGGLYNHGTIFRVNPSAREKTIYSFQGKADGYGPVGSLVAIGSTIYGVTAYGGANGRGTVFAITPDGAFTTIYAFGSSANDLYQPSGGLIVVDGTLYGNASCGCTTPAQNYGGVYSLTPQGVEQVIYRFQDGADGAYPSGELLSLKGILYGVTSFGGGSANCGTVFSLSTGGAITTLHDFTGMLDGCRPEAALINFAETLHGTTEYGGQQNLGTVFSVSTSGVENVLYSFDGSVGAAPTAPLLDFKGILYGTAPVDGGHNEGAVFSLTSQGVASRVLKFDGPNGDAPFAGLTNLNGVLYSTTARGGHYSTFKDPGYGTVFGVIP